MLSSLRATLDQHGKDLAALVLRVGFSFFIAYGHGWPKLMKWSEKSATFSDPLGLSPPVSMAFAIFGELVAPIAIALGLFTRLATIPAAFTLLVAAVVVHKESVLGKGEHALLFVVAFAAIFVLGGGRYSLDAVIARRRAG